MGNLLSPLNKYSYNIYIIAKSFFKFRVGAIRTRNVQSFLQVFWQIKISLLSNGLTKEVNNSAEKPRDVLILLTQRQAHLMRWRSHTISPFPYSWACSRKLHLMCVPIIANTTPSLTLSPNFHGEPLNGAISLNERPLKRLQVFFRSF